MINANILNRLRNGVCAVGYLTEPLTNYVKNPEIEDRFHVVGTGFLVRDEIVLTNRHVVGDLENETKRYNIPDAQHFLMFVVRRGELGLAITPRQVRYTHCLRDIKLDIALIEFKVVFPEHFAEVEPVEIDDPRTISVSEEVAAFGYPHGNELLEKDGRVARWGPVLQQGWISGVAPWERVGDPDEFLLDLRAAEGISGSPVFRPSTGKVFGVLDAGIDRKGAPTTTAFAQPVSQSLLSKWLVELDLDRLDD